MNFFSQIDQIPDSDERIFALGGYSQDISIDESNRCYMRYPTIVCYYPPKSCQTISISLWPVATYQSAFSIEHASITQPSPQLSFDANCHYSWLYSDHYEDRSYFLYPFTSLI